MYAALAIGIGKLLKRSDSMSEIPCLIPGCLNNTRSPFTGQRGHICHPHWRQLQITTRVRFWNETNFGKEPPTEAMRQFIIEEIQGGGQGKG
jgi:hypothetical protein